MADQFDDPFVGGIDSSFGSGGGGNRGGGGGGTGGPMRITPPAPRNVTAKVDQIGQFTVTWKDYDAADWPHDSPFSWFVRYCSAALAGHPGDPPDTPAPNFYSWVTNVLSKSKHVGSIPAEGHGAEMSITHREDLPDGYVLVVGSNGPGVGPSSYPIFLRLTVTSDVIPDVTTIGAAGLTVTKERVPYDVLKLEMQYLLQLSPILQDFAGVHPHILDYNGISKAQEIGKMTNWDGGSGITTTTYRLPVETGLATGTATFTAASTAVTWVSGNPFSALYLGRRIVVDVSPIIAGVYEINSYSAPNIALTSIFLESSGTHTWKILNEAHIHLVPIGKSGKRVGDITTAPLLVI